MSMSTTILKEMPLEVTLKWTTTMVKCKSGAYAGFMQEIPMAAQGDTEEEVLKNLSVCLLEYVNHESLAAVPDSMIKT